MIISYIDRSNLGYIKERIEAKLQELADELDMGSSIEKIRFDNRSVAISIELVTKDTDGVAHCKMVRDFYNMANRWGLSPDDLGKTFVSFDGRIQRIYKILGAKPKNWKLPIIAERVDNEKRYKFSPREVSRCLNAEKSV